MFIICKMLCLHGEPAGTSTTENGTFWFCKQPSKCHFLCSEDQAYLYGKAVKEFLATKQPRPMCCSTENADSSSRNYAVMRVVTDMEKASFGRPFFVCSKENDKCNYFEWGDQRIIEKPLCKHGKPSRLLKVKKEGPNKDRCFFCCREPKENRCKFFKWLRGEPEDPLMPGHICLFSMPPSYKYTVRKTGAMFTSRESDRKKAYAEFLRNNEKHDAPDIHQEHMEFLRGQHPSLFGPSSDAYKKELLEKRLTERERDNKNETVVCKKRKTVVRL